MFCHGFGTHDKLRFNFRSLLLLNVRFINEIRIEFHMTE